MKGIFSKRGLADLASLIELDPLIVFDFDGTLSPIVRHPDRASIRSTTRLLLKSVCTRFTTAILSGRERSDVLARMRGIPAAYVIGNHGLEWSHPKAQPRAAAQIRSWQKAMEQALRPAAGDRFLHIENKTHSLSVHVRDPRLLNQAWKCALSLERVRIVAGKNVLNLLPAGTVHKGTAVVALARKTRKKSVLFVGDDLTDEDVFSLKPRFRLLTIRVGRSLKSGAAYCLENQKQMDRLLKELIRGGLQAALQR